MLNSLDASEVLNDGSDFIWGEDGRQIARGLCADQIQLEVQLVLEDMTIEKQQSTEGLILS